MRGRARRARALVSAGEYVLPARFDDTEIPGLRGTVAYLDLREVGPDGLARAILLKLGLQTELDRMIAYLEEHLQKYKVTIEETDLRFRSEEEDFDASFPIRLMLEMYRADQIMNMFILPAIVPN